MPRGVDPDLLGRLLAEHGPALALMAAHHCQSPDDCVQEALVELAALPATPDRPAAWLYRRVRQRALNAARAAGRRSRREGEAWRERLTATSGPTDAVESFDLVEALAALDPSDRELVTLRFYSGLTYDEIAPAVGLSRSAAHRRTEKALDQLRQLLTPEPCPTRTKN